MNTNKYLKSCQVFVVGLIVMFLTSTVTATMPKMLSFDSVTVEALGIDWQTGRATLRVWFEPGRPCDSVSVHLYEHTKASVLGDSQFVINMHGSASSEVSFNVQIAVDDTSAINGILRAYVSATDSVSNLVRRFALYFINTIESRVASTEYPWKGPDLLAPPRRVERKSLLENEWAPPEGARLKMHSNRELTMDELHEKEKTALDPSYFVEEEFAGGKVWRRKGGEFLFSEKPHSEGVVERFRQANAEYETRKADRLKKKNLSPKGGISYDSMLVLERKPLERASSQMITVEGRIYMRTKGAKEFIEEIGVMPRGHRAYVLDLRKAEHFALADSVIDNLFDTRHAEFYWAWLDAKKFEFFKSAGIPIEQYMAPFRVNHSDR